MKQLVNLIPEILNEAEAWVSKQQSYTVANGRKLQSSELDIAHLMGVQAPEKVYVCIVPHIPAPESGILQWANEQVQLVNEFTIGLTVGCGILICSGYEKDRRLLAHELVHVSQYERFGGIKPFLETYLLECLEYGYQDAPQELEARKRSEELYPR